MHIISPKPLKQFWAKHPNAETPLKSWLQTTRSAIWKGLVDTRRDFPHADLVGICTIFNIGGNKYRLVTKIYYPSKLVLIRFVLTHAEYDQKGYKNDCEC
ncbi:MAG TPA: type II toxin-antitoxin system HigB family toxin [Pyrinomonadaceae bacterium]|jgi:mRNA interferase HigB|nr:type II toxin-antitoxin system HigB family toxin [Pyrinomonadaceae bacterium]